MIFNSSIKNFSIHCFWLSKITPYFSGRCTPDAFSCNLSAKLAFEGVDIFMVAVSNQNKLYNTSRMIRICEVLAVHMALVDMLYQACWGLFGIFQTARMHSNICDTHMKVVDVVSFGVPIFRESGTFEAIWKYFMQKSHLEFLQLKWIVLMCQRGDIYCHFVSTFARIALELPTVRMDIVNVETGDISCHFVSSFCTSRT